MSFPLAELCTGARRMVTLLPLMVCSFLAEALGLADASHNVRQAVLVDFAAYTLMWGPSLSMGDLTHATHPRSQQGS
jgi:hypothetical protein